MEWEHETEGKSVPDINILKTDEQNYGPKRTTAEALDKYTSVQMQ